MSLQGYASRTGNRRNLEVMRRHSWGILISPYDPSLPKGFDRMCLDNGAWTAHTKGIDWDQPRFARALDKFGADADFVVAPDIWCGGQDSLDLSKKWIKPLLGISKKVLIPIQDGMLAEDLEPMLNERVGLFLGGSTEYKWRTVSYWAEVAKRHRAHYHVARVNSVKTMRTCHLYGVDSFDGSGPSRFAIEAERLGNGLKQIKRQPALFGVVKGGI